MQISEYKNKRVYLDMVNFKTEDEKHLGTLIIFTPIPLEAQEVWSLNQLCMYVLERVKECLLLTYKPFHVHKILYFSLHLTDYLIGQAFWAFPIGL